MIIKSTYVQNLSKNSEHTKKKETHKNLWIMNSLLEQKHFQLNEP